MECCLIGIKFTDNCLSYIKSFFAFLFKGSNQSIEGLDSRVDSLRANSDLAASCIKSLFAVLYEVYSSSVSNMY